MNAMLLRGVFGFVILAAAAGVNAEPPKANDETPAERLRKQQLEQKAKRLYQDYVRSKKQFFAARDKADGVMTNRFEATLKQIRGNTRLAAELRSAKLKELGDEKSAFSAHRRMPRSDEMLRALLEYQRTLHKERVPILKAYEKLFNIYSKELMDDARADKLNADKAEFDQKSSGQNEFQRGSWQGTQHGGNNVPFALNVDSNIGNSLKCTVVQNRYPNETVFKMEGLVRGNLITLKSTQVLQGGSRTLLFTGFVVDNRIIGEVISIARNGKQSAPSYPVLYKRR